METEPKKEENKERKISPLEISEKTREELSALFQGKEINGEILPPVYLKLFSGPHATAEDIEGMKPLLDEADMYAPEMYEWIPEMLESLQNVSEGKEKPNTESELYQKLFTYLFGTHKSVMILDVPEEEALLHQSSYLETSLDMEKLRDLPYEEAVDFAFESTLSVWMTIVKNRESYMLQHFAEKLREAVSLKPELQKKEVLRVLMTLGDAHSALYHEMKKLGGDHVSRDFRNNPLYGFENEAGRRSLFGKEISQDMKEKVLCEQLLHNSLSHLLYDFCSDTNKIEIFFRHIVSLFSHEEMKALFEKWESYLSDPAIFMKALLREKDIDFPNTEEELDEILKETLYVKNKEILKKQKE